MRTVRDELERIKTLFQHISEGVEEIDSKSLLIFRVTPDQDSNPKSGAHKRELSLAERVFRCHPSVASSVWYNQFQACCLLTLV
jgi:hypothetical protein